MNKKINFAKTTIATFLIIIGKIMDILFPLLNCQTIGDDEVHYYFGYETCYGTTWILSLIVLMLIIASFSVVFIRIRFILIEDRQDSTKAIHALVKKYKPQYYYWEYVTFIRRIIIALFSYF